MSKLKKYKIKKTQTSNTALQVLLVHSKINRNYY